jgi:acyl-CoA thioester hydrolase
MTVPVLTHVFHAWHCDHFGHVNTRHYAAAFDDAVFAFWAGFGVGQGKVVPVTASQTTTYVSEAMAGTIVSIAVVPARVGGKSVTLTLTMTELGGTVLSTCDVVEVFFDKSTRQSAAMPESVRAALSEPAT